MNVLVKSLGYKSHKPSKIVTSKNYRTINAHIKYIECRPNDNGEKEYRELFGREGEATRQDFYKQLKEQPQKGVIAHKLVFSMCRNEHDNNHIEWKELTRDIMSAYEMKTGRKFNWIATVHEKDTNPHIHLVLQGHDQEGKEVVFPPRSHQLDILKEIAQKESQRHFERNQERHQEQENIFDPTKYIEKENEKEIAKVIEKDRSRERQREKE